MKNGLSEGTIGSIGADFTTGYGRYLATGDESYIPKSEDLIKGAIVEGALGVATLLLLVVIAAQQGPILPKKLLD